MLGRVLRLDAAAGAGDRTADKLLAGRVRVGWLAIGLGVCLWAGLFGQPNCSTDAKLSGAISAPGGVRQGPQVPTQLGPGDAGPVFAVAHPLGHDTLDQGV